MTDPIKSLEALIESRGKLSTAVSFFAKEFEGGKYKQSREAMQIDYIDNLKKWHDTEAPRLLALVKRQQWVLAKAAACMLKANNGITDTVWLDDCVTLYEHLVGELNVEVTGDVEKDIAALEEYASAALNDEGA